MLCSIEKFFLKKSRAELLIVVWQMTCQRSQMFWCALCSHHVFVLLVQFALVHLKIKFVWLCQRLVSLSFKKTTIHINLLE